MLRSDPHALLRISAELHAAAEQPERWPRAWRAVCDFFCCPAVLGMGDATPPGGADAIVHAAERAARAHDCVRARSGACAATDPARFDACSAFLPHLRAALLRTTSHLGDPRAAALEALPYALFVCDAQRRLLHVNATGRCELDSAGWLRAEDGRLVGADPAIDRRLASMFGPQQAGTDEASVAERERHFELYQGDGAIAPADVGNWSSLGNGWDKASDLNVQVFGRVPEPGTLALLGLGLVGMMLRRRQA